MTASEFIKALPEKASPQALAGKNTVFHFDLKDEGQYTVKVEDGKMSVEEGLQGTPKCVLKAKGEHLQKVVSGDMNPMMAVMSGKLKISNLSEMMEYARVFGLKI